MTFKIEIKTKHFNPGRYSNPWIAKVDFSNSSTGEYLWGKWVGDASIGSDGLLVIEAEDLDIVATGQKDKNGKNTMTNYYQVKGKDLVHLSGKVEAYELAASSKQTTLERSDKYSQIYQDQSLNLLTPDERNRYLKLLKHAGLLDQLPVDTCASIVLLMHDCYQEGKKSSGLINK